MKVAVTGAGGFVGSHVVRALAGRDGVEIVVAARGALSAGLLPAGAEAVTLDMHDAQADAYDRLGMPDVVIHAAWGGLPNYRSPHHLLTELPAQYRFLRGLIEAGLPALLATGTCYEYGLRSGELDEEMPEAPANSYAAAKAELCRLLEGLRDDRPFALSWARLFYLWGPRQSPGSLFAQLRTAVARGDPSFPMSPGDQRRDYLPVEVAADFLVELALRGEGASRVNVCSGVPISVRERVELWLEEHGWSIALEPGRLPYAADEPHEFWGSTRKLEALLGRPVTEAVERFSRSASGARSPSAPKDS